MYCKHIQAKTNPPDKKSGGFTLVTGGLFSANGAGALAGRNTETEAFAENDYQDNDTPDNRTVDTTKV
jgi:hypothetical protein